MLTCRNERLNAGAYRLGRMVARGWIDRTDVADELSEAGIASGLNVDEVQRTLASGLRAGMQLPADDLEDRRSTSNGINGGTRQGGFSKAEGYELPVFNDRVPQDGGDAQPQWAGTVGQEGTLSSSRPTAVHIKSWPIMESKATHGIVGRIARLATANSEADPAVIATTLTWAAAEFGRCQFIFICDDKHHSRHFCGIVGQSSRARKGTSK